VARKKKQPPLIARKRPGVTIGAGLIPVQAGRDPSSPVRVLPNVPVGSVMLSSDDPVIDVIGLANTDGVRPVGGGGPRLRVTDRILETSVPVLEGFNPFQITVSLILDGYRDQIRVDTQLENLYLLGDIKDDRTLPVIRISGLVPARFARRDWFMNGDIVWDDDPDPIAVGDGFYRRAVTIPLIERVSDNVLQNSIAKSRKGSGGKNGPRFHTVKKGEKDFEDVSKAEYNTRSRAAEIARANHMSLGARLKVGQKLRLP
jgi:hypothetical protein